LILILDRKMEFEKSNWKAHWKPIYAYVVFNV
jgi:hypothetical protein